MIKLPRLYVGGKFQRILHPDNVSLTLTMVPLSTATISAPDEEIPARSWVELFSPYGSAGFFRVRSPREGYGVRSGEAELEHMISELGDYLVKEEYSEMLAADTAFKRAFKHYKGSAWKLGSVAALGTEKVAYEAKYDRILDVLLSILQQKPDCMLAYDFSKTPWVVSVVKKGTSIAEGRLARNINVATVNYDDSELATRVYYQVYNKDKEATWKSKDADTISKYGVVEGVVKTSSDMTDSEINHLVNTYIREHKKPRASISVEGAELYQITGEPLDKQEPGKLYRLALPDYNLTLQDYITSVTWANVYGKPMSTTVEIGDEEDTVVTFLHNLDATGGGGGGGGKNKKEKEFEWGQFRSDWDVQDDHISGMVEKINKQGKILEQAGLSINSSGVLIYSKKAGGIASMIQTQADRINLVVTKKGGKDVVNAAQIVLEINKQGESEARIKAKRINLDGYVKMKDFNALKGTVEKLFGGESNFAKVVAVKLHSVEATFPATVIFQGHRLGYKDVTINGTTYHLVGY